MGEDKDSRIAVLSDREEAVFRVLFSDEKHEPLEITMAEFIDEKSAKAKGKRVTTLEVARIEDITPEAEPEPEEEDAPLEDAPLDEEGEKDAPLDEEGEKVPEEIEVEGVKMTFEKPQDTQLDLF